MSRTSLSQKRIPLARLAPKALALRERGYTVKQIAQKLGKSERRIWDLLRYAKKDGTGIVLEIPEPIKIEDLKPEVAALCEPTPEAFKAFFERYSGKSLADIHLEWVRQVLSAENRRVLINCPPRHAKSTIFSVWFPLWLIARDRNVQILLCSQTVKLAQKFTREIGWHLAYNQELISDFGRFKPEMADWPWREAQGELMVEGRSRDFKSGDMTIQVRGAGQQILGMEANWVITDDPVDPSEAKSPKGREELSDWFHGEVMSRLEPGGTALVIGQRLHLYDLYGELAEEKLGDKPRWEHLRYPAVLNWETQQVLWPEKWTWQELQDKLADLGQTRFESMYQQDPLPEGERLIRREWVFGDDEHLGCLDLTRGAGAPASGIENRVRVVSLDPSPTRFWGLIVGDLEWSRDSFEFHLIEVVRDKLAVRDAIRHLFRIRDEYKPHYLIVERNAAHHFLQNPAVEELRRSMSFISHDTGRNKQDSRLGVESLAVDFEFGRVKFPYGDAEGRAMSDLLIEEAMTYPHARTDDLLMALWFVKFNYARLVPRSMPAPAKTGAGYWGQMIPPRLRTGWTWQ